MRDGRAISMATVARRPRHLILTAWWPRRTKPIATGQQRQALYLGTGTVARSSMLVAHQRRHRYIGFETLIFALDPSRVPGPLAPDGALVRMGKSRAASPGTRTNHHGAVKNRHGGGYDEGL
jgi:hypothetical protein